MTEKMKIYYPKHLWIQLQEQIDQLLKEQQLQEAIKKYNLFVEHIDNEFMNEECKKIGLKIQRKLYQGIKKIILHYTIQEKIIQKISWNIQEWM